MTFLLLCDKGIFGAGEIISCNQKLLNRINISCKYVQLLNISMVVAYYSLNTSAAKQNGFDNHIQKIRKVPIDHYETTSSLFHVKDRRFGDCMLF